MAQMMRFLQASAASWEQHTRGNKELSASTIVPICESVQNQASAARDLLEREVTAFHRSPDNRPYMMPASPQVSNATEIFHDYLQEKTFMCVIYERVLTAMVTHLSAGSCVDQKHIAQCTVFHLYGELDCNFLGITCSIWDICSSPHLPKYIVGSGNLRCNRSERKCRVRSCCCC